MVPNSHTHTHSHGRADEWWKYWFIHLIYFSVLLFIEKLSFRTRNGELDNVFVQLLLSHSSNAFPCMSNKTDFSSDLKRRIMKHLRLRAFCVCVNYFRSKWEKLKFQFHYNFHFYKKVNRCYSKKLKWLRRNVKICKFCIANQKKSKYTTDLTEYRGKQLLKEIIAFDTNQFSFMWVLQFNYTSLFSDIYFDKSSIIVFLVDSQTI